LNAEVIIASITYKTMEWNFTTVTKVGPEAKTDSS
jgi:hypothetical protein